MSTLDEIKARVEKLSGLCPDYMRAGIRHLQRNCEVECPTHGDYENCEQPDRYDGDTMAQVLTENAKLIAALEAVEALLKDHALRSRAASDRLNQQVIDREPGRDAEAANRYAAYAATWESAQLMAHNLITVALQ